MNIFGFFRRKGRNPAENTRSKIEFGFRGEGITYSLPNRSADVWFTWMDGARIYTATIAKWRHGSPLTRHEKEMVFNEVLRFVVQKAERPIIVINEDDPSKELWEQLCSANQPVIKNIEYTSREKQTQLERSMYLGFIKAGKKVVLDGTEIANEQALDEAMQKRAKSQP